MKWHTVDGSETPIPYEDADIENHFWEPSEWEDLLPGPGFLKDFSYTLRGVEAHPSYIMWSAIFAVSSALKRQARFRFDPLPPLYPNFYVIFVGPPSSGKSTAIREAERVIHDFNVLIPDRRLREVKRPQLYRSKATPEAVALMLSRYERTFIDEHKIEQVIKEPQSEVIFITSELDTFLGRQTYNTGLVSKLTDWYDCKDFDDDSTVIRGNMQILNVFVSMLGGTTPDKLDKTLPDEVFGGGFMSRTIFVNEGVFTTPHPFPVVVKGAPERDELKRRLAWIAWNGTGEFTFSPEAVEVYKPWYYEQHRELIKMEGTRKMELHDRMKVHIIKLAMVIRAQRYDPGTTIEAEDLKAAINILKATYKNSYRAVVDVGSREEQRWYTRTVDVLRKKEKINRRALLQSVSPYHCTTESLQKILMDLSDQGLIDITMDGERQNCPSRTGRELYAWMGSDG